MANEGKRRPINRPKFHHTTFATTHLHEMVEFYEKVAGSSRPTNGVWTSMPLARAPSGLTCLRYTPSGRIFLRGPKAAISTTAMSPSTGGD